MKHIRLWLFFSDSQPLVFLPIFGVAFWDEIFRRATREAGPFCDPRVCVSSQFGVPFRALDVGSWVSRREFRLPCHTLPKSASGKVTCPADLFLETSSALKSYLEGHMVFRVLLVWTIWDSVTIEYVDLLVSENHPNWCLSLTSCPKIIKTFIYPV